MTWQEALVWVAGQNLQGMLGFHDWRLPNRRELRSLIFRGVDDVYWSSTTSLVERDWAWALYLEKGAIGVGQKTQTCFHVWAVQDCTHPE